jgi:hypothetical protein
LPGSGAEKETGAAVPGGAPAETAVPEWIVAAVEARRASVEAGREAAVGPLPEGEAAAV